MRKNTIVLFIFIISITIIGQIGKRTFDNIGFVDINDIEGLHPYQFSFETVDSEDDVSGYVECENKYIEDFGKSENIIIAEPTGKYKMGSLSGMQEVEVKQVIKGNERLNGRFIWIDGMPGLDYYEEEELIKIDALTNYMQYKNEYLISCDSYGTVMLDEEADCSKYYSTSSIFGYLNISNSEEGYNYVNIDGCYTFDELKNTEFFGSCEEVIVEKYRIKNSIIDKYISGVR